MEVRAVAVDDLLEVLREARVRVAAARKDDLAGSSWLSADSALADVDRLISTVERGEIPQLEIAVLFAPTGPLQEVSIAGGWSEDFLGLAGRVDAALGQSGRP